MEILHKISGVVAELGCVCKWGAGCVRNDKCGGSCNNTGGIGCGWFWLQTCTARCSPQTLKSDTQLQQK